MPNMVLRVSRLWWAGLLLLVPPPRHCGIFAAPPPPPAPSHSSNPPVSLDSTAQGDCDLESWTIPTRALGLDTTEGRTEAVRRVAWSKAALEAAVTAGDPVVFKDVPLSHLNWTPERLATALPAVQCFVQPRDNAVFRYWSKSAVLDPDFTLPPQPPEQIVPAADFFAAVGSPSSSVRLYASGPLEEVLSPALRAEAEGAEELFSVADPMRRYAQGSKANGEAGQGDGREVHVGTNHPQSSEHEGLHKAERLSNQSGINNHTGEPADRLSDAATSGGGGEGTEWRAETLTSVWFGGGGVTAAMHYDTTFNVHATLSGTKRYTLAHPRYHVEGLFPSLHPHYRQLRGEAVAALVTQGKAVEIEVKPGEALYLPPFWFHQVVSASEAGTVSISFWSESTACVFPALFSSTQPLLFLCNDGSIHSLLPFALGCALRGCCCLFLRFVSHTRWTHA
eukprot:m.212955 g.212955  ORF g.212955 m.212955 type:complete len:451 (-) comp15510_c0_seq2:20-1372(-)